MDAPVVITSSIRMIWSENGRCAQSDRRRSRGPSNRAVRLLPNWARPLRVREGAASLPSLPATALERSRPWSKPRRRRPFGLAGTHVRMVDDWRCGRMLLASGTAKLWSRSGRPPRLTAWMTCAIAGSYSHTATTFRMPGIDEGGAGRSASAHLMQMRGRDAELFERVKGRRHPPQPRSSNTA